MDEFEEDTTEHDREVIDHALVELEVRSQRRIALEAVDEMMD